jgi:hypothetical protein
MLINALVHYGKQNSYEKQLKGHWQRNFLCGVNKTIH